MPEIFRLLYSCGFRVGEVLKLRVRDVDLNQGIITVRQGKFRKDRLVPPSLPLVNRLQKYAAHFEKRPPDAIFFPGPNGGPVSLRTVYTVFRRSEEHTSELQSHHDLVCRLLLEKKKKKT